MIRSTGTIVSAPGGSAAPVMMATQLFSSGKRSGALPAACVPATGNVRAPAAKAPCRIAMPSMVTRSKGGWSRSAVTACRKHLALGGIDGHPHRAPAPQSFANQCRGLDHVNPAARAVRPSEGFRQGVNLGQDRQGDGLWRVGADTETGRTVQASGEPVGGAAEFPQQAVPASGRPEQSYIRNQTGSQCRQIAAVRGQVVAHDDRCGEGLQRHPGRQRRGRRTQARLRNGEGWPLEVSGPVIHQRDAPAEEVSQGDDGRRVRSRAENQQAGQGLEWRVQHFGRRQVGLTEHTIRA